MTDWNGIGAANWVGLENFQTLIGDPGFRHAFRNNVIWLAMFLTVPIAMALVAASLLAPMQRGRDRLPDGAVHPLRPAECRHRGALARSAAVPTGASRRC